MNYVTNEELDAGLTHIEASPRDGGRLELLVRRPNVDARELLDAARLDIETGLVGDRWNEGRSGTETPDYVDMQLTVMNSRAVALVAQSRDRWALAGDQLYVDLDLSDENLPPGSRLKIGEAVIEITALPHTGCGKFSERFGRDATRFFNSIKGRQLNLRGVNAKVLVAGTVRVGDIATKVQH